MKKLDKIIALFLLLVCFGVNAQKSKTQVIQDVFDQYTQDSSVHNAFFNIRSKDGTLNESLVYGQFQNGEKLTRNTPFYTASIGKTFTATAVALLEERGLLTYDDLLINHLGKLADSLLVVDGVDFSAEIKIHHLLSHSSGLPDYFGDRPRSGANMLEMIVMQPEKKWQPEEIIAFTKANFDGHFRPGQGYHYSDTEYVLLGLLVEKLSGKPLHEFFQSEIFDPLHLDLTSMNMLSEPKAKPDFEMAEMYADAMEISRLPSLSADWAGGAIVSTGEDLNRFIQALLDGEIVSKEKVELMQQWSDESLGTYYGYGLRKLDLPEMSDDFPAITLIGHSGSNASFMYYCPELELYLSGTFNQLSFSRNHVLFLGKLFNSMLSGQ